MYKIPISGGPHTGKTTLLDALRHEYPSAHFVEEPAEIIIARELQREQDITGYKGVFPVTDYPLFAPKVVEQSLLLEARIPKHTQLTFQDRSLIDNIGYGTLNGHRQEFEMLERLIPLAGYAFAFFCEPVGRYTGTDIRHETAEQARQTHEHLAAAYHAAPIDVIHLPAVSVPERLTIIRETIDRLTV